MCYQGLTASHSHYSIVVQKPVEKRTSLLPNTNSSFTNFYSRISLLACKIEMKSKTTLLFLHICVRNGSILKKKELAEIPVMDRHFAYRILVCFSAGCGPGGATTPGASKATAPTTATQGCNINIPSGP